MNKVTKWQIMNWICEHKELKKDFKKHFKITDKQLDKYFDNADNELILNEEEREWLIYDLTKDYGGESKEELDDNYVSICEKLNCEMWEDK